MPSEPDERTRCPWPECGHHFEVESALLGRVARCPKCGEEMTVRPITAWDAMEKRRAALAAGDRHRLERLEGPPAGAQRASVANRLYHRDPEPPHEVRNDAQYEAGKDLPQPRIEHSPELVVVLDDIRSQWNTGSIFRTAEAAGFGMVALAGITPLPVARSVQRVALGAAETLEWVYEPRIVVLLRHLIDRGFEPVALEQTADAVPVEDFEPPDHLALVVGSEVGGVSHEALRLCRSRVHIPLAGNKASLNVAVAFGVAALTLGPRWRTLASRR